MDEEVDPYKSPYDIGTKITGSERGFPTVIKAGSTIPTAEELEMCKDDKGKSRVELLPKSALLFEEQLPQSFVSYLDLDKTSKSELVQFGLSILEFTSMLEVGKVLAFGAEKYSEESWKQVAVKRYWGALGRHLHEIDLSPVTPNDSESGLNHYAHAMTNVLFILELTDWKE